MPDLVFAQLNDEAEGEAEDKARKREQAFVQAQGSLHGKNKWHTTSRSRKDAVIWISTTDNSMRQTMGVGLSHFVVPPDGDEKNRKPHWNGLLQVTREMRGQLRTLAIMFARASCVQILMT